MCFLLPHSLPRLLKLSNAAQGLGFPTGTALMGWELGAGREKLRLQEGGSRQVAARAAQVLAAPGKGRWDSRAPPAAPGKTRLWWGVVTGRGSLSLQCGA